MKNKESKTVPGKSEVFVEKKKRFKGPSTEPPIAEKDEEKKAEDELRERMKRKISL